jgi:subtilisin family serine protease
MRKKYVSIIAASAILFSLISYKEVSARSSTYNDVAAATTPVKFRFTLDKSVPYIGATKAYNLGYTGADQYVVVIDTGVETAHPFLQGKVALEACFSDSCPNGQTSMIGPGAARPVHWHGTHVAGIVAGSNSNMRGVAPGAKIIAVNVFDASGAAYDDDIIKALNWVNTISSQYNIVAVNMSLGSSQVFRTTCDGYIPSMTDAIKALRDKKIATVISSGNSYAYGMSAPACITYSVSVAATMSTSDVITTFSNVNENTTFAAPGNNIVSSGLMGSYRYASGTSMSSPHVAGAFAVYTSKYGRQDVSKIVSDFQDSAPLATDAFTGIKRPRLYFDKLFSDGSPSPTTTVPVTTTTIPVTTTVPVTTTTVVSSTTTVPVTTTVPSPTTTLPVPPFHPTLTKPMLLDLYGGYSSVVYVKYRVPVIGRQYVNYYNLYCDGKNVYQIPHQTRWTIDTYRLDVPASNINYCYMTAMSIYGKESTPSTIIRIYPRNK